MFSYLVGKINDSQNYGSNDHTAWTRFSNLIRGIFLNLRKEFPSARKVSGVQFFIDFED